jgi:hypothetical protein
VHLRGGDAREGAGVLVERATVRGRTRASAPPTGGFGRLSSLGPARRSTMLVAPGPTC